MKHLIIALVTLLSTSLANAADLSQLAGKYVNQDGDAAEITLEEQVQADLFAPKEYAVLLTLESADGSMNLYLEETLTDSNAKEVVFDYSNDCDDPGCTTQSGSVTIALNTSGVYEMQVSFENSKDVQQDMEETFGETGVYDEETVKKYCVDTFGTGSFGYTDGWEYGESGYATCEYTYEASLEKL